MRIEDLSDPDIEIGRQGTEDEVDSDLEPIQKSQRPVCHRIASNHTKRSLHNDRSDRERSIALV
jgi:hypothetical protein